MEFYTIDEINLYLDQVAQEERERILEEEMRILDEEAEERLRQDREDFEFLCLFYDEEMYAYNRH